MKILANLLPLYLLVDPIFSCFFMFNKISFYIDTPWYFFDLRSVFYLLFVVSLALRVASGMTKTEWKFVLSVCFIALFYLISILVNCDKYIPFQMTINGGALFFVFLLYVFLFRKLINPKLLFSCFSVSMIIYCVLGIVFLRTFAAGMSTLDVIGGELSDQLWNLAGGKTQFIPAVMLQALIVSYFDRKQSQQILHVVALMICILSLSVCSQVAAIPVILLGLYVVFSSLQNKKLGFVFILLIAMIAIVHFNQILRATDIIRDIFGSKLEAKLFLQQEGRFEIWPAALKALTEDTRSILAGVGDGGLNSFNYEYYLWRSFEPDCGLLYLWECFGIIGALLIVFFIVHNLVAGARRGISRQWLLVCYFFINFAFVGFYFFLNSRPSDLMRIVTVFVVVFFLPKESLLSSRFIRDARHVGER